MAALGVFAADQATKSAARSSLQPGHSRSIVGNRLRFTRVENAGVAFGLLNRQPRLAALGAGLAPLLLLVVAWRAESRPSPLGMGLVVGGWAGNALDRFRRGSVTDFLDAGIGSLRWPAFNLADAAVVVGSLLLARSVSGR